MSKKCTPLWREAHFQVKMYKANHCRITFGSWDVEKVHAVVARSTFPSENVQNTPLSDHFWKLRCRKSARRCGAKHISKSKCTKHIMLGPLLEVEMSKTCAPLRREAHFQVKMYKAHHARTTFGNWNAVVAQSTFPSQNVQNTMLGPLLDEKVHAVVARSTFPSQNVQNTPLSDHFWKLRCRKSARRCGAKHVSKWKCRKHTMLAPLLEVEMSKKCTPLWREAHFQVKMYKTHHCRTTFGSWDVEKVHAVVARSTFPSENVQSTPCSDHFWKLRCRKSARRCGVKHISKSKCTKHIMLGPLLEVEMSKKCTPLWREAHFEVKIYKAHHCRTTCGSCDVWREAHFQVKMYKTPLSDHFWKLRCRKSARRCGAKHISKSKCTNTPLSDHFWKLRCRKSARRCGTKHISKSKCTKHHMFAPLLEVQISKKCTPLWREAHFEVKMYKALGVRTTFGGSDVASLRFGSLHYTIHSTTLQYITLHNTTTTTTELHNYTPLHATTLNYNTLRHITLHSTTLHYTIHSTTLHYTTLHYTIHSTHYSTLHYTTLHNTTTTTAELHNNTPLHSTTHRYTKLHYTTLHYTRKIDR